MAKTQPKRTATERFTQPFITGILGVLPLAITLAVLVWLVMWLHDLVGPSSAFGRVMESKGLSIVACEVVAYAVGLAGTLALVYLVGLLIESGSVQRLQSLFEHALHRVPLVNKLYDASQHLTGMFEGKSEGMEAMTPVMCFLRDDGGPAALGWLPSPKQIQFDGRDYYIVIIPKSPIPFGGTMLCVPADCVKPAGCSFDGLVNVLVTMGVSAPDYLGTGSDAEEKSGQ
jgi:uncharacterized membrane protein